MDEQHCLLKLLSSRGGFGYKHAQIIANLIVEKYKSDWQTEMWATPCAD